MGSIARTAGASDAEDPGAEASAADAKTPDSASEPAARAVHPPGGFGRRCRAIAEGAVAAAATYAGAFAATGGDVLATEDVVDLAHSAYTSSVAVRGIAALRGRPGHVVALPAEAASDDGAVVRMFCRSIGYFFADVALVLTELCVFGRKPHLWHGRLAHHAVQAVANLTCIFKTGATEQTLALRSVLCIAYFAEFSNIFLRLSNILRRRAGTSARTQKATNIALLVSFAACRMVNFPWATWVFLSARRHMQRGVVPLIGSIQASGYLLNLVWFMRIVKILGKPSLPSSVPS